MNPYENASINQPGIRGGNGSAHELLGTNLTGSQFQSGAGQVNPGLMGPSPQTQQFGFGQQPYYQQNQPWQQNVWQQNPWQQSQGFQQSQPWLQGQFGQQQNPYLGSNLGQTFGQGVNPLQQLLSQQHINPFLQQQLNPQQQFSTQQQFSPQMVSPGQQTGVITTKSVEVNVNVPAQRVIGRHPIEVQQYIMQVVLPVLLDGLTRRAVTSDVGHSITSDLRECVVRIEI